MADRNDEKGRPATTTAYEVWQSSLRGGSDVCLGNDLSEEHAENLLEECRAGAAVGYPDAHLDLYLVLATTTREPMNSTRLAQGHACPADMSGIHAPDGAGMCLNCDAPCPERHRLDHDAEQGRTCTECGGPLSDARNALGLESCSGPCNVARRRRLVAENKTRGVAEDIAYEHAVTVDSQFGCCHDVAALRAGGRVPEFDGDAFEPLPEDCPGRLVLVRHLTAIGIAVSTSPGASQ